MKKIILALLVVIMAMTPVMADENWVGVDLDVPIGIIPQEHITYTDISLDATVRGAFYLNRAETMGVGVSVGFGGMLSRSAEGHSLDWPSNFVLSPGVTFQYRLELNDDMDLRFGLGMAYDHMFYTDSTDAYSLSTGSIQIAAEASFVYSFDQIGIVAGVDIGVPVYTFSLTTVPGHTEPTSTELYGVNITPRVGVSYAF